MQSKIEYSSLPIINSVGKTSASNSNNKYRNLKRRLTSNNGRKKRLFLALIILCLTLYLVTHLYIFRDLIYFLRPLFDHDSEFTEIPHYYDPSMNISDMCEIHGWKPKPAKARVIDVIIFSIEFDLLELRLRELWNTVDIFIVIEADRSFSGKTKPLWLQENMKQYEWANSKLRHHSLVNLLRQLSPKESPFVNENLQRQAVTTIVGKYAHEKDLIILSDVDEIPRSSTVDLIRSCDHVPDPLHLQLRTYYYSFEYYYSLNDSWRAKIQSYDPATFAYNHSQRSQFMLADSGWHCTFCFRFLGDFRFKMLSYSHNDRLMGRKELLSNEQIQYRVCNGLDIFDMWPEVYTWRQMAQKFGPIPASKSMIDVPKGLISNPKRFRYLLPGNCIREDFKSSSSSSSSSS